MLIESYGNAKFFNEHYFTIFFIEAATFSKKSDCFEFMRFTFCDTVSLRGSYERFLFSFVRYIYGSIGHIW